MISYYWHPFRFAPNLSYNFFLHFCVSLCDHFPSAWRTTFSIPFHVGGRGRKRLVFGYPGMPMLLHVWKMFLPVARIFSSFFHTLLMSFHCLLCYIFSVQESVLKCCGCSFENNVSSFLVLLGFSLCLWSSVVLLWCV